MKDFCYWETQFVTPAKAIRKKMLLVTDDNQELKMRFNLTMMGCDDEVNSYEDLMKLFPTTYYELKVEK